MVRRYARPMSTNAMVAGLLKSSVASIAPATSREGPRADEVQQCRRPSAAQLARPPRRASRASTGIGSLHAPVAIAGRGPRRRSRPPAGELARELLGGRVGAGGEDRARWRWRGRGGRRRGRRRRRSGGSAVRQSTASAACGDSEMDARTPASPDRPRARRARRKSRTSGWARTTSRVCGPPRPKRPWRSPSLDERRGSRPSMTSAATGPRTELDGLQQRRAHQELLEVAGQLADDLLGEVLVELALGAAERRDEGADLARVPIVDGGSNELQRGRPALGPPRELGEDGGLEAHVVRLAEEPLRLGGVEAEVVGPELGDLAERPQASEADRRLAPAGEHERHPLRPSGQELAQDVPDVGRVVDQVEVVEDEGRRVVRAARRALEGTCRARCRSGGAVVAGLAEQRAASTARSPGRGSGPRRRGRR